MFYLTKIIMTLTWLL